ncbi:hypothetical protein PENTCL1PPCAC_21600, partial [Pristionchus entomophagus]
MRFVVSHCPTTRNVVKLDDDMAINLRALIHRLPSMHSDGIYGLRWTGMDVIRDKFSKWYIPYSLFPFEVFPQYTSGSAYIVGLQTIRRLLDAVKCHGQYMHVDDAYVTGILARSAGVRVINRALWWNIEPNATDFLRNGSVIFALHDNTEDLVQLYCDVDKISDDTHIATYPLENQE